VQVFVINAFDCITLLVLNRKMNSFRFVLFDVLRYLASIFC
jgi:hypothetical protein